MVNKECKLGAYCAKRFPTGVFNVSTSECDAEWLDTLKFNISGWDYPMVFTEDGNPKEGIPRVMSLARAVLARHGFNVPEEDRVWRIDSEDHYNITHDNLIIPESLVPEFPLDNNYNLTLAAYKTGLAEAASRLKEGVPVICMDQETLQKRVFIVDEEDVNFFSGTKVKFSHTGVPMFMCEDLKFRNATQELIRRGRFGVSFGCPSAITRRLSDNKFDLRKGLVAVFRTIRKPGR